MSLLPDGTPADSAVTEQWLKAVRAATHCWVAAKMIRRLGTGNAQ